jgi:hypothetical protein
VEQSIRHYKRSISCCREIEKSSPNFPVAYTLYPFSGAHANKRLVSAPLTECNVIGTILAYADPVIDWIAVMSNEDSPGGPLPAIPQQPRHRYWPTVTPALLA